MRAHVVPRNVPCVHNKVVYTMGKEMELDYSMEPELKVVRAKSVVSVSGFAASGLVYQGVRYALHEARFYRPSQDTDGVSFEGHLVHRATGGNTVALRVQYRVSPKSNGFFEELRKSLVLGSSTMKASPEAMLPSTVGYFRYPGSKPCNDGSWLWISLVHRGAITPVRFICSAPLHVGPTHLPFGIHFCSWSSFPSRYFEAESSSRWSRARCEPCCKARTGRHDDHIRVSDRLRRCTTRFSKPRCALRQANV